MSFGLLFSSLQNVQVYICTYITYLYNIHICSIVVLVTEEEVGESLPSARRSRDREQSLRPFLKNGQRKRATTLLLRRCIDVKKKSACILDMKMIYLGSKCKVFVPKSKHTYFHLVERLVHIKLVVGISEDKRLAKKFQF